MTVREKEIKSGSRSRSGIRFCVFLSGKALSDGSGENTSGDCMKKTPRWDCY